MKCHGKLSNASLWLSGNRVALSSLAPGWFYNSAALIAGNAKMDMWSKDYLHFIISNLKVHMELVLLEPHTALPFTYISSQICCLRLSNWQHVKWTQVLFYYQGKVPFIKSVLCNKETATQHAQDHQRLMANQIYSPSYTRTVPCFAPRPACDSRNRRRAYLRSTQKHPLPI